MRFPTKPIVTTLFPKILALVSAVYFLTSASFAQDPPQQSSTGPTPPPGIAEKVENPEKNSKATTIDDVPAYSWRHGCGPTALGMVMGYYDAHGFGHLIPGDASTQTNEVNQAIASEGSGDNTTGIQLHYEDYSLPMDSGSPSPRTDRSANYPDNCHDNNCLADWMETSWSSMGNYYGWSFSDKIIPSFTSYVDYIENNDIYTATEYRMGSSLTFDVLKREINNDRPMVFLVDTDSNGGTDHFVTIVGFIEEDGEEWYGCLDTWAPTAAIRWCEFKQMSAGVSWGIWGGWSFHMQHKLTIQPTLFGSVKLLPDQTAFDHDKPVILLAVPTEGFEFKQWTGSVPKEYIYSNPILLYMTANKSVRAIFQEENQVNGETWLIE